MKNKGNLPEDWGKKTSSNSPFKSRKSNSDSVASDINKHQKDDSNNKEAESAKPETEKVVSSGINNEPNNTENITKKPEAENSVQPESNYKAETESQNEADKSADTPNNNDKINSDESSSSINWASKKKAQKKDNIISGIENKKSFREIIDKFGRKRFIIIVSTIASVIVLSIFMAALTFEFHIWGNHDWTPATCEEPKTCEGCGAEEGEPLGHKWKEATCTTVKRCTVCGKESGEPLGHKWKDATCEKARTCSVCNEKDGEPLGHDWSELKDCEKPQECKRCGKKKDKGKHDWKKATCEKPKTCSVCGKTSGKAKGHDWTEANCQNPKTCKNCKKTEGKLGSHSWKPATLTEPKTCYVCGKTEGSKLNYYSIGLGIIITDDVSGLNLRREPDKNSDKITTMSETAPVMVYNCNLMNWYYVEYDGEYGYASSDYITLIPENYYGSGYSSCKLEKVISADIDNDNVFEAVAFYTDNMVVVYEKNGKSYDYEGDSFYGYEYHLVKDSNSGSVYLGCETNYGREEYESTLSKVYPNSDYQVIAQFDSSIKEKTKAKYDEYMKKVVFVDEVCSSGDSYNYGHWLDYTFTVN